MSDEVTPTETVPSAAAPQESAPETKSGQQAPATVEANGDQSAAGTSVSKPELPHGVKREMFEVRQKNRELKQQMDRLQQELSTLKTAPAPSPAPESGTANGNSQTIFDNPDQYLANREQALAQSFEKRVQEMLANRDAQSRHQSEATAAEQWLLAQKELKDDPEAKVEIEEMIVNDPEIRAIAGVSPKRAARLIYDEWRERKGLNRTGTQAASARASGVAPSATSSSGPKTWTRAEIAQYLDLPPGDPKLSVRHAELLKAQLEGRIK